MFKQQVNSALLFMVMVPFLLSSCAFLQRTIGIGPIRPKVKVVSIKLTGLSLNKVSLGVKVKVDNGNGFDLELSSLDYEMTVEDKILAKGNYKESFIVPAEKTAYVELPLEVDTDHVSFIFKRMMIAPDGLYAIIKAKARFETAIGGIDVDFEDKKKLIK